MKRGTMRAVVTTPTERCWPIRTLQFSGDTIVIHYTCDRCKRTLDPQEELRYVVRMEVRAAMDLDDSSDDQDDRDYLLEVHEILESADDLSDDDVCDDIYQQLRFDLCPECYRRFVKNPVGKEASVEFNFSQN